MTTCDACGKELTIGEWPYCPHGRGTASKGFEPYWDNTIADQPQYITSGADYKKFFKPQWNNDYVTHLVPRDKPDSYYKELNDRREHRREETKRAHQ